MPARKRISRRTPQKSTRSDPRLLTALAGPRQHFADPPITAGSGRERFISSCIMFDGSRPAREGGWQGGLSAIQALVNDIAKSAQEQSAGLSQINSAVAQMGQVAQQNAAMVEEVGAASHGLTREASELTRLVQGGLAERGCTAQGGPGGWGKASLTAFRSSLTGCRYPSGQPTSALGAMPRSGSLLVLCFSQAFRIPFGC